VIKTIGDEVLFTVADPAAAVEVALALTARGADEDDPFPAVRAGVAHGAVVRRLGDVFGSTVNAASRLTSAARPGSVLVDAGVHAALTADEDDEDSPWRWRRVRRVSAKGFKNLEAWRVRPRPAGD
jgi:adenylate cyclase